MNTHTHPLSTPLFFSIYHQHNLIVKEMFPQLHKLLGAIFILICVYFVSRNYFSPALKVEKSHYNEYLFKAMNKTDGFTASIVQSLCF